MRRPGRTAGLTLVELMIVAAIVAMIAGVLGSAVVSSSALSREVYVDDETIRAASTTIDTLADELSRAGRYTRSQAAVIPFGGLAGEAIEFQNRWADASSQAAFGLELPGGAGATPLFGSTWNAKHRLDWRIRAVFVAEATLPEAHTLGSFDINNDGDTSDTVTVGRMELRYFSSTTDASEVVGMRRALGGRTVRVVRDARNGTSGTDSEVRIFSRPNAVDLTTGAETSRRHLQVLADDGTPPPADPSVLINLRIVHNPVPDAMHRRMFRLVSVSRLSARR